MGGEGTGPGASGHLPQATHHKAGPQGLGAGAVRWGCSSLVPGRRESGRKARRKGGRPPFLVFQIRASPTQEPLATVLWTSSSAGLQLCLSFSAVSNLCSHRGTEARGYDKQLLAGGKRLEGRAAGWKASML